MKKLCFFVSRNAIYLSLGLHKGRPSYRRKKTASTSKDEIYLKISNSDPDSESGSGSREPMESGSNPYPDPQHW
jgi:hypothetical protein